MQNFTETIPLSLYIHLPWCVRKCPYCDFNSHKAPDNLPEELYVNALIKNFEEYLPQIWGRRLISIFFGGGTPSLFSPQAIERILTEINARLPFNSDIEITLEANPGTIDESRFIGFRQAGINRLSIGIQSLQDEKLKALGRIHNRKHALNAVKIAKRSGFDNFNIDLMHGLPDQSVADALSDLEDAIACEPTHLSWYQLTIEPNTLFHHQPPTLPPEETLWEIQERGKLLLAENSFLQYEVSAYSKQNKRCVHNINYWEFGDYIGIGAGAHGKITLMEEQVVKRAWQVKNPRDYLDPLKNFIAEEKTLEEKDISFEFMLNALRLTDGINKTLFAERTGLPLSSIEDIIASAQKKGLLETEPNLLQTTALGQRFLDNLVGMFLKD